MIQNLVIGFGIEKKSNLYKNLGVHQFKKIVPLGDLWIKLYNKLSNSKFKLIKTKKSATIWLIFTLSVESLHLVAFFILLWITITSALDHDYFAVLKWTIINIIINLYPIMVQRYNRIRLIKTFKITRQDINDFHV